MTFSERIEKITVPMGVAADRLHRELSELMEKVYLEGVQFGLSNAGKLPTGEIEKLIKKHKMPLNAHGGRDL